MWPRHFKEDQDEATNAMNKMKYPKVSNTDKIINSYYHDLRERKNYGIDALKSEKSAPKFKTLF